MMDYLTKKKLKIFKSLQASICVAAFSLAVGCGSEKEVDDDKKANAKSSKASTTKPVLVEVEPVKRGAIEEVLERSAALQAEEQVQVLARTQNPAIELLVEEGDHVEKFMEVLCMYISSFQIAEIKETVTGNEVLYANGWVARYCQYTAKRLRGVL